MGRIVEEQLALADSSSNSSSRQASVVKVHVHGELDTNDKWFPLDSASLVLVAVTRNTLAAVGAFPARYDCVVLLQTDHTLYELLRRPGLSQSISTTGAASPRPRPRGDDDDDDVPLLVGTVVQALPAHDASVVDVVYPPVYHHVATEWRIHIGNGYVRHSLTRPLTRPLVSLVQC